MSREVILDRALELVLKRLDELCGECVGPDGKPRAPSLRGLMRARAYLPERFANTLTVKKRESA